MFHKHLIPEDTQVWKYEISLKSISGEVELVVPAASYPCFFHFDEVGDGKYFVWGWCCPSLKKVVVPVVCLMTGETPHLKHHGEAFFHIGTVKDETGLVLHAFEGEHRLCENT